MAKDASKPVKVTAIRVPSIANVESPVSHPTPKVKEYPNRTSYLHKLTEEEQKLIREKIAKGEVRIVGPDSLIVYT